MNTILAESKNFIITNDYEKVFLLFRNKNRRIYIADFYGDPQAAAISDDEGFCVIVGCGMIIYHLKEPFEEYSYNTTSEQWKELFRVSESEWWIEAIDIIDNSTIFFNVDENDLQKGGRYKLKLDSLELIKYI